MEEPTAVSSFLKRFFRPQFLTSLKEPLTPANTPIVYIFRDPDAEPEKMVLEDVYPFLTIQDLKTLIYIKKQKAVEFYPAFQALMIPIPVGLVETDSLQDDYRFVDFDWLPPGKTNDVFNMKNPFLRMADAKVDERFVTSAGGRNLVEIAPRSRVIYEEVLPVLYEGEQPILHLFLYSDVIAKLNPALRTSEREWYGRLYPYFPELTPLQEPKRLNPQQATISDKRVEQIQRTYKFLQQIDGLLDGEVNLYPMVVAGVKFLRLVWKIPSPDASSLETLFYRLPVTPERPFLRMLPDDSTPINKIRLQGVIKVPDISDPRLLLQWADERNPTADKDFLFAKVVIRPTIGTQPAIYGTLRMFEDRTGDFLVNPPKQLKKLDPRSDLLEMPRLLVAALKDTPFEAAQPDIGEASLICGIRMPTEANAITKQSIRKRLALFKPFFQEIGALPGEQPLVMLRYRAVSKFANEDRIYTFLTQVLSRKIIHGDLPRGELVEAVVNEFQIPQEEATKITTDWLRSQGESQLVIPETKDFIMTYNRGVDIGIFAQHPFYTFHLYRVDSILVLDRILTLLSLLMSAEEEQLAVSAEAVASLGAVANDLTPVAEGSAIPGAAAAAAAGEGVPVAGRIDDAPPGAEVADVDIDDAFGTAGDFNNDFADLMFDEGGESALDLGDFMEESALQTVGEVNVAATVATAAPKPEAIRATLADALPAPAASAAAAAAPKPVAAPKNEEEEEEEEDDGKRTYAKYLAKKLQEADERLFVYKSPNPAVKIKKYVTMCQATETRQPAVLNQEQYERMREIYSEDEERGELSFLVFPLEREDEDELPPEGRETYTILRYGSDPLRQNYYLCSEFFCIRDYILVREKDFYSDKDRKGKPKPGESRLGARDHGSCPFCHGLLIKSLKDPGPNETVIQRRIKSKSKEEKRHLWIGFLRDTYHPEEFYLPCCFAGKKETKKKAGQPSRSSVAWDSSLKDTVIRISDRQFAHIRAAAQRVPTGEAVPEGEAEGEALEEPVSSASEGPIPFRSYFVTLERAYKKYIVGPEKFPLKVGEEDGPQIGLLPPVLDTYFAQNPADFVSREYSRMELKPTSEGFLRVGVENRSSYLPDSFFAAIAPYLEYRNNANEVKIRLEEVITPRIFLFLNFGNLVLEFYDPTLPNPSEGVLRQWVSKELYTDITFENRDAVLRLYKSYNQFKVFLRSTSTLKQYRQFAQVLALPGLVTRRGLLFIVLDINEKEEVEVRCPPFGYDLDRYASADIAFILHHHTGVWEPVFYSENKPARARFAEDHQAILGFQRAAEASWPKIVKQRFKEFMNRCGVDARGQFTLQSGIQPQALVPMSRAVQLTKNIFGIIRDSYNHAVGLTYRLDPEKGIKQGLIAVPYADDGTYVEKFIHFDWDDYPLVPMEDVIAFYKNVIEKTFSLYKGYRVKHLVKSKGTRQYEAIQLENGIFIPCLPPRDREAAILADYSTIEIEEMEWQTNRDIAFLEDEGPSKERVMKAEESELEEVFQHLRLSFSAWFSSEAAEATLREDVGKILFRTDLPLFEKRKRLLILLESTLLGWMDSQIPAAREISSLLRVDCRVQTKARCTGRCVWRQRGEEVNAGRCYLHVPERVQKGKLADGSLRYINGPRLLVLRLIEELLRFPERRRQLLQKDVPTLVSLREAVQLGDQWIVPETSLAWYDLMRLDWIETGKEKRKYFEEFSSKAPVAPRVIAPETGAEEAPPAAAAVAAAPRTEGSRGAAGSAPQPGALPDELREIFGEEDPKTQALYLYQTDSPDEESPLAPYLAVLGLKPQDIGLPVDAEALTEDAIRKITLLTRLPVLQFNLLAQPPNDEIAYGVGVRQRSSVPFILVISETGPALLSSTLDEFTPVQLDQMPSELFDKYELRSIVNTK